MPPALWKNEKNHFFSSNQLFSNFVDKIVTFTKFLPKMSDATSAVCTCDNFVILLSPEKFSMKMNFKNYKYLSF